MVTLELDLWDTISPIIERAFPRPGLHAQAAAGPDACFPQVGAGCGGVVQEGGGQGGGYGVAGCAGSGMEGGGREDGTLGRWARRSVCGGGRGGLGVWLGRCWDGDGRGIGDRPFFCLTSIEPCSFFMDMLS